MIGEWTTHVLQSTAFAVAAGLLTLAFRRNRAGVRYWIWLSASLKFFVPFALLMSLGSFVERRAPVTRQVATPAVAFAVDYITAPGTAARPAVTPLKNDWTPVALAGLWACGFVAILLIRCLSARQIYAAVCSGRRLEIQAEVEIRSAPGLREPGVVGLLRPVLLLPEGIEKRLEPAQLEAVIAHELCHVRRRDNAFAAAHMIVEAVFWFHPMVWWIGARLIEERERACDEEVLSLGIRPRVYADAILSVCRLYVESPLPCVSGITGFDLERRVKAILTGQAPDEMRFAKRMALAVAGITALTLPIGIGVVSGPALAAQSPSAKSFGIEAVSIAACGKEPTGAKGRGRSGGAGGAVSVVPLIVDSAGKFSAGEGALPGKVSVHCQSVAKLIQAAYILLENDGRNFSPGIPIESAPSMGWIHKDRYEIRATAPGARMPDMAGPVLQSLLEDQFRVKAHRITREVPVYQLTVAEDGSKLRPFREGSCVRVDFDKLRATLFSAAFSGQVFEPEFQAGLNYCANRGGGDAVVIEEMQAVSIDDFIRDSLGVMDRPVVDKTGLAGLFNFHLEYAPDQTTPGAGPPAVPPSTPPGPTMFAAVQAQLGLKLTPAMGPREFLVIDRVEKPSLN